MRSQLPTTLMRFAVDERPGDGADVVEGLNDSGGE